MSGHGLPWWVHEGDTPRVVERLFAPSPPAHPTAQAASEHRSEPPGEDEEGQVIAALVGPAHDLLSTEPDEGVRMLGEPDPRAAAQARPGERPDEEGAAIEALTGGPAGNPISIVDE